MLDYQMAKHLDMFMRKVYLQKSKKKVFMIKKIKTDMHTHTRASGDSYSTLLENIKAAKKNGIEAIAITEHGPATHGSANPVIL